MDYHLTISGTRVKAPQSFDVAIQDIDAKASRDAHGLLHRDRLTTKRKLTIKWGALSLNDAKTILGAVKSEFFKVEYLDPEIGGLTTKTFYVGDRTVHSLIWSDALDGYVWQNLSFDLVEQ